MNKEQLIKNIASLADKWEGLTIERQEEKVFEEYNELLEAKKSGDIEEIQKELADVIITMLVLTKLQGDNLPFWTYILDSFDGVILHDSDFEDSVYNYFLHSLNNTATQYNINVWECLEYKYNIVAKREGKVINGTFVKNENHGKKIRNNT